MVNLEILSSDTTTDVTKQAGSALHFQPLECSWKETGFRDHHSS